MTLVPSLLLPKTLPSPKAMESTKKNSGMYEPSAWELEYQYYRYLEHVEDQELDTRYAEILKNMKTLVNSERHIIPIISFLSSWYWYRKEHQTRLEFHLRKRELPTPPPTGRLNNIPTCPTERPPHPNAGNILYRYSKNEYNQKLLRQGEIRISHAINYSEMDGDLARFDNECQKDRFSNGSYVKVTTQDGKHIPIIGHMKYTVSSGTYYMLCMSCDWDDNLFTDFDGADSCLVIRDVDVFAEKLNNSFKHHLENWIFHHNPVEYYDPYEQVPNQYLCPVMCKDFKFAYQREYRFIWETHEEVKAERYLTANLGSLKHITELHS